MSGDVLQNSDLTTTTGSNIKDNSGTQTVISQGSLLKSIYAINSDTGTFTNPSVAPGDTVTYRLTLQLATSNFDKLTLADYLPLPVYDATTVSSWSYGPSDTFHLLPIGAPDAPTPILTTNGTANSVLFTYGNTPTDITNHPSTIDLLFNVQVGGTPFADGLLLTNMAQGQHSNTSDSVTYLQQALQQSVLTEPNLTIKKGIVITNDGGASYSQAVGPTTFTAPGSSGKRFVGTIDSAQLTTTPIDANIRGIQASDTVTFADVVQNIGTGLHGAFNVTIQDALPTGFTGATNIEVTDGNGNALAYTGNLFGAGIVLTDPNTGLPGVGALTPYSATSGTNLVIITYDAVATQAIEPNQLGSSSATVTNYASVENGANFVPKGITDAASVRVSNASVAKSIVSTSQPFTTGTNLTIGETAQYQVVVRVPQGTAANTTLVDTPTAGLGFVSLDNIAASSALSTSIGSFNTVLTNAQVSSGSASFNFGTLTNTDTNDATAETITLTYTVVALNNISNHRGGSDQNNANFRWDYGSVSGHATVGIVEPELSVSVTPSVTSGQAGTPVTYTLVLTDVNDGLGADAFKAALQDTIPSGVDYVAGSLQYVGGTAPDTGTLQIDGTGHHITAGWTTLTLGQSATFTFQGVLDNTVSPTQPLVDTANVTWTSLPNIVDPQTPESIYSAVSVERTGNTANPGGASNTYLANGSDTITVFNVGPVKSIVAASEAFTGIVSGVQTVTIGEVVRYRLQVQLPNSTMNGFTLVDALPAGLGFVDPNNVGSLNAKLVLIADQAMTLPADLTANYTSTGTNATTPTVALDTADIGISGQTVTFSLGNLVNNDTTSFAAYATLDFDVLVLNSNANHPGDVKTNGFNVLVNSTILASNTVDAKIVEPAITSTLTVSPGGADAGDTMTYTAVFTNTGTSPGFDSTFLDTLPNTLTLVGSATTTLAGGAAGIHNLSSGNQISLGLDTIPVNGSVTVVFKAKVNSLTGQTIPNPGDIIPNSDTVTTTTLPGTGTTNNPTGENTPGGSGAANGERNGSGGVNDLFTPANAPFPIYTDSVTGYVYRDNNNNGTFESGLGETGVGGVSVTLTGTNQLNQAISLTTTTAANGYYHFDGLRPGTYTVAKTPVAGLFDGKDSVGTLFGGGNGTTNVLNNLVVPHGASRAGLNYNFAELVPSTFTGYVYLDNNDNGVINTGETGVGSVTVTLAGKDDLGNSVTRTAVTSVVDGSYSFGNLRPSDGSGYTVTETPPSNYLIGKDTPGSVAVQNVGGTKFNTVLLPNTNDANNNYGELLPSALSGYVYRADNLSGISGVTITLTGTDDLGAAVNRTTTTNAAGFYSFGSLRPGTGYTITETRPLLFGDGTTTVGTQGGSAAGNSITVGALGTNVNGLNNNFGEINPPPAITPIPDATIDSCIGQSLTQAVAFADPAADGPYTLVVNYGDGSPLQTLNIGSAQRFVLQHAYTLEAVYQVTVSVQDSYGKSATTSFLVLNDAPPPTPYGQLITVNDNGLQRSMITSLTVTFDQLVTFDPTAFVLKNQQGTTIGFRTITRNVGNQTVVLIEFTDPGLIGGSLADGTYTFTVNGAGVHPTGGGSYTGGNQSLQFFRKFGDVNGDGLVNGTDLAAFNWSMRSKEGTPHYVWYLDYEQNCVIDAVDYRYFLMNFHA